MYYGKGVALLLVTFCEEWIVAFDKALSKSCSQVETTAIASVREDLYALMTLSGAGILHRIPLCNPPWSLGDWEKPARTLSELIDIRYDVSLQRLADFYDSVENTAPYLDTVNGYLL